MSHRLEVLFSPAEFAALKARDLTKSCCVVFDVLRASSSMITALASGAAAIVPVETIADALKIRESEPGVLLAGERHGVRIRSHLTGSIDFDLGNSPREFTAERVHGKTVVMTTTNGTLALRACAHAERVLVGSFLNLRRTADAVLARQPAEVLLICSGTFEEAAYEDALAAGAFCEWLWSAYGDAAVADSALMVRKLLAAAKEDLAGALSESRNGKRLLARPELAADVAFCAVRDRFPLLAELDKTGRIRPSQV
jgi:2-phosphosulfolactate phosphatase